MFTSLHQSHFTFLCLMLAFLFGGTKLNADDLTLAEAKFISNLKAVYLTPEAKAAAKIGIEIEFNGITEERAREIVAGVLGGNADNENSQWVRGTVIGDVRVYRDGGMWQYQDWARIRNGGRENRLVRLYYSIRDNFTAPVEIALPHIRYDQLHLVEEISQRLAAAGARGTKGLSGCSIHVNQEVDKNNSFLLKNIAANYTNNGNLYRSHLQPTFIRRLRGFIRQPGSRFRRQLGNYDYLPTAQELWADLRRGSHVKFSRVNIALALLENESIPWGEREYFIKEGWGHRPTAEFREADTVFEPGYVTDLVDMSIATVEASKVTGNINALDLQSRVEMAANAGARRVPDNQTKPLWQLPLDHSITRMVNKNNFVRIRMRRLSEDAHVSYADRNSLINLGLLSRSVNLRTLKDELFERYGFEVVRPGDSTEDAIEGGTVFSLAYDDGYLGRGDGRATWLHEVAISGVGTFDFGTKGTGLTEYGIPQESIDAGFHIGEKDGYLSLEEAMVTLQISWMLKAIGLESEQIISITETGKTTGHNIDNVQPAASVVRYFENGLRGAHLRKYSESELRRVAYWLRLREAVRLGRHSEDPPPTEVYLENKIRRDARRAAIAQHFWVLHGAINVANIYENGWADLNYVEALRVPDGHYTPLNVYSRLEYQANEFLKVTEQFVEAIQSTDPSSNVNTKKIYWEAYNEEFRRLELIAAGLSPEVAEAVVKKHPKVAARYADLVWDINYNHLATNTEVLRRELPLVLSGKKKMTWKELSQLAHRACEYTPDRVYTEEMFFWDRWMHRIGTFLTGGEKDRMTDAPVEKLIRLSNLTKQLAQFGGQESSEFSMESMAARANDITEIVLPNPTEYRENYQQYVKSDSKSINAFLAETQLRLSRVHKQIQKSYGPLQQSARQYRGQIPVDRKHLYVPARTGEAPGDFSQGEIGTCMSELLN